MAAERAARGEVNDTATDVLALAIGAAAAAVLTVLLAVTGRLPEAAASDLVPSGNAGAQARRPPIGWCAWPILRRFSRNG